VFYEWIEELTQAVEICKKLRKKTDSPWLFSTRTGQGCMSENGRSNSFDSIWQRFMAKALKETKPTVRFTEYDLRAKVAYDNESERARQLLVMLLQLLLIEFIEENQKLLRQRHVKRVSKSTLSYYHLIAQWR
jgi:hypothetical protein